MTPGEILFREVLGGSPHVPWTAVADTVRASYEAIAAKVIGAVLEQERQAFTARVVEALGAERDAAVRRLSVYQCPDCGGFGLGPDRCDGPGDVYQLPCESCEGSGLISRAAIDGLRARLDAIDSARARGRARP